MEIEGYRKKDLPFGLTQYTKLISESPRLYAIIMANGHGDFQPCIHVKCTGLDTRIALNGPGCNLIKCMEWVDGMTYALIEKHMDSRIEAIAEHYGIRSQLNQTMEECAELTQECSKSIRLGRPTLNLADEIADVEIMIEQVKFLFGITDETIQKRKDYKLDRQLERMKADEEGCSHSGKHK